MPAYRHKDGSYLRLIRERSSGINTFVEVDESGSPIIAKMDYSARPTTQERLIKGFDNLIKL